MRLGHLAEAVASRLRERPADLLASAIEAGGAHPAKLGDPVEPIVGGSACATLPVRTQARSS
jgi:hypothetical protein